MGQTSAIFGDGHAAGGQPHPGNMTPQLHHTTQRHCGLRWADLADSNMLAALLTVLGVALDCIPQRREVALAEHMVVLSCEHPQSLRCTMGPTTLKMARDR